jgi:hypothetical protein
MKTIALIGLGVLASVTTASACDWHNAQAASNTQMAMTDQQQNRATPVSPEQRAEQWKILQGMQTKVEPGDSRPAQN